MECQTMPAVASARLRPAAGSTKVSSGGAEVQRFRAGGLAVVDVQACPPLVLVAI